jgi:hypothetical protein
MKPYAACFKLLSVLAYLGLEVFIQEDVGGFDVPMNQFLIS